MFGAEFGGFPNPPPLSISISRCDNYCCFPYHLKRITNSYTHSSVDCKSTEHPQQRMFGAGFGGFAIRRIRQAQQQDSQILIQRWIANPPNIRRNGVSASPDATITVVFLIISKELQIQTLTFRWIAIAFPFGQRPLVPPNIRCIGWNQRSQRRIIPPEHTQLLFRRIMPHTHVNYSDRVGYKHFHGVNKKTVSIY